MIFGRNARKYVRMYVSSVLYVMVKCICEKGSGGFYVFVGYRKRFVVRWDKRAFTAATAQFRSAP